jgi:predicted O-methyltransferase YrrM
MQFKKELRRILHFLFALFFCGDVKFLFYLLKEEMAGRENLGDMSSFIENIFLYRCAAEGCGEGGIVEIGSFKGRTTVSLAMGSKLRARERVLSVDPQEDLKTRGIFMKNIKQAFVDDYVIPCFKKSEEAIKDFHSPIRLLFIDGCHEYEELKKDILLWKNHLIDGGIIALHDYLPENYPAYLAGVNKAVTECVVKSSEFIIEGCCDTVLFASKKCQRNRHIFRSLNRIQKMRVYFKSFLDKTILKY